MNLCMLVNYDGSPFAGWQKNKNTGGKRALQTIFDDMLSAYFAQKICVKAAGRTDAGVHAVGQVLHFRVRFKWEEEGADDLREKLNAALFRTLRKEEAGAVVIRAVKRVPDNFHSRFDAEGKTYEYYFDERERESVFARGFAYPAGQKLDMEAMRQAAAFLIGTHDFSMFSSVREGEKDTVRTITDISIERMQARYLPCELVRMSVTGDGFLYHMVRIIAGTLLEAGTGKRSPKSVKDALAGGVRAHTGVLLPGNALFLKEVYYETLPIL